MAFQPFQWISSPGAAQISALHNLSLPGCSVPPWQLLWDLEGAGTIKSRAGDARGWLDHLCLPGGRVRAAAGPGMGFGGCRNQQ